MSTSARSSSDHPGGHFVPNCWAFHKSFDDNLVSQLVVSSVDEFTTQDVNGKRWIASAAGKWRVVGPNENYAGKEPAIRVKTFAKDPQDVDFTGAIWEGSASVQSPETVLESIAGSFNFTAEDTSLGRRGLRSPQLGAAYAVLSYWTLKQSLPATVVMPTGTGKTETMLTLFAVGQIKRLLVLVPSDALRDQLSRKFETYGVLREFGLLQQQALFPVVGKLRHGFKTVETARNFARLCNVIVATPQSLNACPEEVRDGLLAECSHLFVDEAHHITAPTWRTIRNSFTGRPVVQFTATPFREDGADLGGKLIYVFPLRAAQEQGYFSKINYFAVTDFDNIDAAIAAKAVERLRDDIQHGFNHILMARVNRTSRAKGLLSIYEQLALEFKPVILHSDMKPKHAQRAALAAVRSGESRIIICVDMLGEGFDLPSLKIAAIHDAHKSLGITLQFIGRFARAAGGIGEASVVVGRTDPDFDENLKKLYAEDADWNQVITDLSESAVGAQVARGDFDNGFRSIPEEVSLQSISPRMSAVVYKTFCQDWKTEALEKLYGSSLLTKPFAVNEAEHVAWLVTKHCVPVRWADTKAFEDIEYQFYLFYWDQERKLLYINSSNNESLHEDAAKALCGDQIERIKGPVIYRTMAKINRRIPTNIGLLDARDRKRSFALYSGANVTEGFPDAQAQTKTQTNIFAYGYECGDRVSIGISLKGRIWSFLAAPTLKHWVDWCNHIGSRLIDESINIDEVIASFIRPEMIESRPNLIPLALDWPWEATISLTEDLRIESNGTAVPLIDVDLVITDFKSTGPIPFSVVTSTWTIDYLLVIDKGEMTFSPVNEDATVVSNRYSSSLSGYLNKTGLRIILEKEVVIHAGGMLVKPNRDLPPYDPDRLIALDWTGINISKESQGKFRDPHTVQARMIQEVKTLATWDLVIDDDASGETADIVAIRSEAQRLIIMLVHCKFSQKPPGARVHDLYEVCGQAQKSAEWRRKSGIMLKNLLRRDKKRRQRGVDGFEIGNSKKLHELYVRSSFLIPEFHIAIAQPGVSKANVSSSQLNLLSSTEIYVREVAEGDFTLFTSA